MNKTTVVIAGLLTLALFIGAGFGIFMWNSPENDPGNAVATRPGDKAPSSGEGAATETGSEATTVAPSGGAGNGDADKPAGPRAPSFDVVRVSPDGFAVFAGRAERNWTIYVRDAQKTYGSETADSRGEWVVTLTDPLAPGSYEFSLIARNKSGSKQAESEQDVLIVVPERDGKKKAPLVVELGEGKRGTRVLQAEGVGRSQTDINLTLDAIDYAGDGSAVMSGTAPEGTTLRVYLDNEDLGDAVTGDGVHWSIPTKDKVAAGPHLVRIDEVDQAGKVLSRVEAVFERVVPGSRTSGSGSKYQVEPGNSLWRIARRYYGDGFLYTDILQANRTKIVDPDLIYPGQIFVLPRPTQPIQ